MNTLRTHIFLDCPWKNMFTLLWGSERDPPLGSISTIKFIFVCFGLRAPATMIAYLGHFAVFGVLDVLFSSCF
ncbi:hypothetical protein L596_014152 [Steinernema carpocapsae]|uniref:Uncharacterized protein n=1 Tax=Steinernema carpocapsae TaxID=34508 RepID=A0A4U5NBM0_STECR|nr:hypothetical protein L596_014152 [Steinernema carpocapsae]